MAGYAIGQNKAYIDNGYLNSYDDVIGSPQHDTNNSQRLPGDYYIVDFNGDGVVDSKDQAPYGYSDTPQNTYNATLGFEWKGFSAFVQFYGVNNVTRVVQLTSFGSQMNTVYDQGSWWSEAGDAADVVTPRWLSKVSGYSNGTQYYYDGSYIRLKNAEIAYTFTDGWVRKLGVKNLKIYLNGNNLWVWSKMPDDRESNFAGSGNQGAYPTVKRFNLLLFSLGFSSCEDYLDKEADSTVSEDEAFKNFRNFQGFIEEIYNCIPDKEKNNYTTSWNWGDDEIFNPEGDSHMTHQVDLGTCMVLYT